MRAHGREQEQEQDKEEETHDRMLSSQFLNYACYFGADVVSQFQSVTMRGHASQIAIASMAMVARLIISGINWFRLRGGG